MISLNEAVAVICLLLAVCGIIVFMGCVMLMVLGWLLTGPTSGSEAGPHYNKASKGGVNARPDFPPPPPPMGQNPPQKPPKIRPQFIREGDSKDRRSP
jgi:hypothetical protein